MASRILFAVPLVITSWLGMQVVHEFGHAAAAWATGGQVERVVLLQWSISRTDIAPNPHPLAVVWGGPVLGVAIPLLAWGMLKWRRSALVPAIRFFAGFCLVANGLYLGLGSFEGIGDAGDLLRLGAPRWCLVLFGAITVPCGLVLWHGQGRSLGMVEGSAPPSRSAVQAAAAGALGTAVLGMVLTWLGG